jgi:hypothetical protein
MDRNKQLQEAYTVHHESVLLAINPESVIGFLFAEKVLSVADNLKLTEVDGDTNKTRQLLAMLHARGHPESFIKLHEAIKRDQSYEWLVEQIDDQCARSQTFSDAANKGKKMTSICVTLIQRRENVNVQRRRFNEQII